MDDEDKKKAEEIRLTIGELEKRRKELLSELGEGSMSWKKVLMGMFGVFLAGGGIIALFAAHWDSFGRESRAVITLLPVALCGVTAFWAHAKGIKTFFLWDLLGAFWCVSVAVAVGLLNVDGSVQGSILLAAILMLPVIWVTRSATATELWPVMAIIWVISSRSAGVEAPIGFAVKSLGLLALSLPAYVAFLRSRPPMYALASVQVMMGLVYSLGLGTVLWLSVPSLFKDGTMVIYLFWLCAALVAVAGYVFSLPKWRGVGALVAVGVIFPIPFMQFGTTYVVALVIAVGIFVYGVRMRQLGFANLGTVAFLWLVLVKFLASDPSFLFKCVVLIAVGVLLTVFNIVLVRHCKERMT